MEQKLLQALSAHYNAKLLTAEANLINYFRNATAIAEHPDVVSEMTKLIDNISGARGSLEVLASMVQAEPPVEPEAQEPSTPTEN